MKAKRLLFKTSGIFKIIVGVCVFGIFALILLLSGVLKDMLIEDTEMLNSLLADVIIQNIHFCFHMRRKQL